MDAGVDEVVAVYCEPDKGEKIDPIKEFALEKGLPIHQPPNFNDQADLDTLAGFEADLMVMAFVNVFVPEAARGHAKTGFDLFSPQPAAAAPGAFGGQLADHNGGDQIRLFLVLPIRWIG